MEPETTYKNSETLSIFLKDEESPLVFKEITFWDVSEGVLEFHDGDSFYVFKDWIYIKSEVEKDGILSQT